VVIPEEYPRIALWLASEKLRGKLEGQYTHQEMRKETHTKA
jgi:hypothetical protein